MAWLGNPDHSLSYKERLAMIKERAQEMGEPARSAFTWIPEDTLVHKADISYWITQPWDNREGRMTLVGDAAHPMPPCEYSLQLPSPPRLCQTDIRLSDRGQGLNHCICDVSHLLDALLRVRANETTFKQAISAYDAEIVPRGCEEVKCSLENGYMLHDWQKVKQSPVFTNGFKPMTGHDGKEPLSEHAQVHLKMEEEARRVQDQIAVN